MQQLSLDKLPLNTEGTIIKLNAKDALRRRFLDLGLVAGTQLKPIFVSPSGDPTAYEFRGSLISIRKDDAKLIEIKLGEWLYMGLTSSSTGNTIFNDNFKTFHSKIDYTVALSGNPNVRKIQYF